MIGAIQRRAGPRPNDCTLPAAESESSARCTVRGLAPSAIASAELDHASPSVRKASIALWSSSTGGTSTPTLGASHGTSAKPRPCRRGHVGQRAQLHPKSPYFDPQPRAMRFIWRAFPGMRKLMSLLLRHVAGPGLPPSSRASAEQDRSRRERYDRMGVANNMAARVHHQGIGGEEQLRHPRAPEAAPRRAQSAVPPGAFRDARRNSSTSAISAGMPASRAARIRPAASATRAALVRRRRIAIPATTSAWAARGPGGNSVGSISSIKCSASSSRPISSKRRTSSVRACAALTWSPCASRVARAASSASASQPRETVRETRAISASATTHRARALAFAGPNLRAALPRSVLARTKSPNWAIAMPRNARPGASSRNATHFNAPIGSPAASARAAAVISEAIRIPPHL